MQKYWPPTLNKTTIRSSTSSSVWPGSERSVVFATRTKSGIFANSPQNGLAEGLADTFDRNAVEDLLEEATDDQPRSFLPREAARLGIKNQLFVDFAARRTVRAADVVALDLQARNRISPRIGREQQVVVPLVAVGFDRLRIDLDHPAPNRPRLVLQRALIKKITAAFRRRVMLQRVIRDVLLTFGEQHTVHLALRPAADQLHVLVDFRHAAADRGDRPLDRGIASYNRLLMGKVPHAVAPVLQGYQPQPSGWSKNYFGRAAVKATAVLRRT